MRVGCALGARWVRVGCALGARWVRVGCALGARWVRVGCALGARWVRVGCALGARWVRVDVACALTLRVDVECMLSACSVHVFLAVISLFTRFSLMSFSCCEFFVDRLFFMSSLKKPS